MSHPAMQSNRIAKAERIRAYLLERQWPWKSGELARLNQAERNIVTDGAGERVASEETWTILVALFKAAEDVAHIEDVFGGLS